MTHNGKQSYDKRRENRLRELGFNILRLDGYYLLKNITGALELIMGCIEKIENNTPLNPPLIGGRDPIPPFIRGNSCIANKNNKLNVKYLLTFDTTFTI